jgi:hypothetical protein
MSNYRNSDFDYRNDPLRRDPAYDGRPMNAMWGWIAAAVFIVVVLAFAFGSYVPGQPGTNTASNDVMPPAATRMAPPLSAAPHPTTPAPVTPTPNSPAAR